MNLNRLELYKEKLSNLERLINSNGAWLKYFITHFTYDEQKKIIAEGTIGQLYKAKENKIWD